jgi:predicted nuclease of predicted toxin-antitoxin system
MARLYSNENFPLPVVEELRRLGHDVLTIQETGHANREVPDEAVLSFAAGNNRAVLTINRKHFIRLHKANAAHQGIIVCSIDLDFTGQARRIDEAIQVHDTLAGILIRVNRPPMV